MYSAEVQGTRVFAPAPWQEPPMFVAGGSNDRLIPTSEVVNTAAYYNVAPLILDGMAHTVMVDPQWKKMAAALKSWIAGLSG